MKPIDLKDIEKAREKIQPFILDTPTSHSRSCSKWVGTKTYLKFENQQTTGSFKIRGALNKILNLTPEEKKRGIVASSAGNHAQGVAFAASQVGVKATVVMPTNSPLVKVTATQGYGAHVVLHGDMYDDAYQMARTLEKEKGYVFVHPYMDPLVIAGQGTIGLEILASLPDVNSIVIPIGGGGLISGVATAIKALRPEVRIYGAVPENAPGMFHLFHGEKLTSVRSPTIADGLAVKNPSPEMCETYLSTCVEDVVTVKEEEISEAIVMLLERAKTVVEGSGAVGLAAAAKANWNLGEKTCVLLCGGNIDLNTISKVIERGLSEKGRLSRIGVRVSDRPGILHALTGVIAEKRANILQVNHNRLSSRLALSETQIEFLLETRSQDHIDEIKEAMTGLGAILTE
jgi:threonine dehydratase